MLVGYQYKLLNFLYFQGHLIHCDCFEFGSFGEEKNLLNVYKWQSCFVACLNWDFRKCHCFSLQVKKLKRNPALLYFCDYFLCKLEKWSPRSYVHNADFSNLTLLTHNSDFSVWFHANLDFWFLDIVSTGNITVSDMDPDLPSCNSKVTSVNHWICFGVYAGTKFSL